MGRVIDSLDLSVSVDDNHRSQADLLSSLLLNILLIIGHQTKTQSQLTWHWSISAPIKRHEHLEHHLIELTRRTASKVLFRYSTYTGRWPLGLGQQTVAGNPSILSDRSATIVATPAEPGFRQSIGRWPNRQPTLCPPLWWRRIVRAELCGWCEPLWRLFAVPHGRRIARGSRWRRLFRGRIGKGGFRIEPGDQCPKISHLVEYFELKYW